MFLLLNASMIPKH